MKENTMKKQDFIVKVLDMLALIVFMALACVACYLFYDYHMAALKHPPVVIKVVQVPGVDYYDTVYLKIEPK
jgi:hypothetical protein